MKLEAGPALFIQPHYDDVALSCGGTAALWSANGHETHIVTVFASDIVDEMVGDFAAFKHSRWKLDDLDAVHEARRAEDAAAAKALGCKIRWLGFPDAIYRGDRYTTDLELYHSIHEDERRFAVALAEEILSLPEWNPNFKVFVPLGIGNHVDHQIVFEAGSILAQQGYEVWAYQDLPYSMHSPDAEQLRTSELSGRIGAAITSPIDLATKLEAVSCYKSQLPVIFRFTNDLYGEMTRHAYEVGAIGDPAERLWPVANA